MADYYMQPAYLDIDVTFSAVALVVRGWLNLVLNFKECFWLTCGNWFLILGLH